MLSRRLRTVLAAAIVVLASTFAMLAPGSRGGIAGLSTDTLFWLRQTVFGPRATAAQSPIALILIDENSYDTFKDLPKDFWRRSLAPPSPPSTMPARSSSASTSCFRSP